MTLWDNWNVAVFIRQCIDFSNQIVAVNTFTHSLCKCMTKLLPPRKITQNLIDNKNWIFIDAIWFGFKTYNMFNLRTEKPATKYVEIVYWVGRNSKSHGLLDASISVT